jgi:hypothetical protein
MGCKLWSLTGNMERWLTSTLHHTTIRRIPRMNGVDDCVEHCIKNKASSTASRTRTSDDDSSALLR